MDLFNKRAYLFAGVMFVALLATMGYLWYVENRAEQVITPMGVVLVGFLLLLTAVGVSLAIFPHKVKPVRRVGMALVPFVVAALLVVMHGSITRPDYNKIILREYATAVTQYTHYFTVQACKPVGEVPETVDVLPWSADECLVRADIGRVSVTLYYSGAQPPMESRPDMRTLDVLLKRGTTLWIYVYDHQQPQNAQPLSNPPSVHVRYVFTNRYWLVHQQTG